MAENTTSWILELVDKITAPVKKIMTDVGTATLGLGEFSNAAKKGTAVTDEMLKTATDNYNRLAHEVQTAEDELKQLKEAYSSINDEAARLTALQAIEAQTEKLKQLNEEFDTARKEIFSLGKRLASQAFSGFINALTKPIKELPKTIKTALKSVIGFRDENQKMTSSLKSDLDLAKREYNRLGAEITKAKKKVEELERSGLAINQVHLDNAREEVAKLEDSYKKAGEEVQRINGEIKNIGKGEFTKSVVKFNQFAELIGKINKSLQFTVDYKNQEKEIQRLTDLTGAALTEYTKRSREIADVYGEDAINVAKAANSMTEQLGGTYESNFELLEEGFKKGANLSGNLLSNMEKYSSKFVEMGLSGKTAMAIMAKAEKDGFDADKAIEGIKQAGEKLTELGPTQQKVLKEIGISMDDLSDKTAWEAVQTVSKAMDGMSNQTKSEVLTNIFGKAGKDSGISFVQGLAEEIPDLSKLEPVEESAAGFKRWASNIKSWIGDVFGNVGIYVEQFAPLVEGISGAIPIIELLTKVTGLQTVATRLLGITILGTPIGWIIAGIAALVGIVWLCWEKFEGFRKVVFRGWEVLKLFGSVIKDYVINRLKDLLSGITGIAKSVYYFFTGEWKKAWETGTMAVNDVMGNTAGAKAGKQFIDGYQDAIKEGDRKHELNETERKKKDSPLSVNEYIQGEPSKLSYNDNSADETKKTKTAKEGGMSIGGRGAANIRLTINNYFNVGPGTNVKQLADRVAGVISDRLQDAIVSV